MIKLGDKQLNADVLDVLTDVKTDLAMQGVSLLADIKKHGNSYLVSCPVHKQGQEKHASCSVDCDTGIFHCFTCGISGNLAKFVSYCYGRVDEGAFGKDWLLNKYETITLPSLITPVAPTVKKTYATEGELQRYRYYHPYMFQRGLTEDVINKFDIGYDAQTDSITFPVRDIYGNLMFVARRSVNTKFYHYPEGVEKPVAYLNYIPQNCSDVWVCESFINALTCWKRGICAVALMGLGTAYQAKELCKRKDIRGITLAFDGDVYGDKGAVRFGNILKKQFIVEKLIVPPGKDLNDLTDEEWTQLTKTMLWK